MIHCMEFMDSQNGKILQGLGRKDDKPLEMCPVLYHRTLLGRPEPNFRFSESEDILGLRVNDYNVDISE